MKRLLISFLAIIILLTGCGKKNFSNLKGAATTDSITYASNENGTQKENEIDEMRAVWITFYELSMASQKGGNENMFTEKIENMFKKIKEYGLNTVFVHVRPYSDSLYPSRIYPWSFYCCGTQGENPGYDPLKIMTLLAKKYGLSLHAWINPFRVLAENNLTKLSKDNPAKIWLTDNDKANDSYVFCFDKGIYLNPSVPEVHALIYKGVREIIDNYNVDGIHIDDYFYPTVSSDIDAVEYKKYCESGGEKSLSNWRRDSMNTFISGLYNIIKNKDKNLILSISPTANIDVNIENMYADVKEWSQNEGYTDYIIPQIYFGFNNEKLPFKKTAEAWEKIVTEERVKLAFGLAPYKIGKSDAFAGNGLNEWIENPNMISQQMEYIKSLSKYDGYCLFSFQYVFR